MKQNFILLFLTALITSCSNKPQPELHSSKMVMSYQIPYNNKIEIDANSNDWSNYSSFDLYCDFDQQLVSKDDFSGNIKFAWNEQGLCFIAEVNDDNVSKANRNPWATDGIEIFLAPEFGDDNLIQYAATAIAPSADESGLVDLDFRKDDEYTNKISWKIERKENSDGYTYEGLIPLESLNITPESGSQLGVQVFINDLDDRKLSRHALFYATGVHNNSKALYPFTLVKNTKDSYNKNFQLSCALIDKKEMLVKYVSPENSKQKIQITQEGVTLNEPKNSTVQDYFVANLSIDANELNTKLPLYIKVNDAIVEAINLNYIDLLYVNEKAPYKFEADIRDFEAKDAENPPPANATLTVGSSSIRMWRSIHEDLEGMDVIARGFGGSKAEDVLHYMDRIVLPYKPAKILFYEGDNDIGGGMEPEAYVDSVKKFINIVQAELPKTEIYILSTKPSIRKFAAWKNMDKANQLIKDIASDNNKVFYVDVASAMFDENGELKKEIFLKDGVHMKPEGYEIWTKIIREALGLPPKSRHSN